MSGDPKALRTDSGLPVDPVYGPERAPPDPAASLGEPGHFPFTRGIHPEMYRTRLWTMRQYAGFGNAGETNARYRYLLDRGQTGLSVAFDLPTQMGLDSDDPRARGEVGRAGVAIDTVEDMAVLFSGIPLEGVSTSMTINATAPILLAMYVALAEEQGIPMAALSGTVQNDLLKEYVARGTYVFPVEASLRLAAELIRFCTETMPRWHPVSVSGYHMREAGATAPQEIAFTLAHALAYVERALAAGAELEAVASRLSFFFAAHNDFFEEIAKFRAARRLWANLLRERHGASEAACRLRFHTQTGGSTLQAQQPLNNVVRVTTQALSAVLGGTQSLHANGYDEALALPSEAAANLALRTQQILAWESGVSRTVDPLAGSYFVEDLTDRLEAEARRILREIDALGGAERAIDFVREAIHREAWRFQQEVEAGRRTIVGVNRFREGGLEEGPVPPFVDFERLASEQRRFLGEVRARRDGAAVETSLAAVGAAARGQGPVLPPILEAVRARASVGEITHTLRGVWGTHDASAAPVPP